MALSKTHYPLFSTGSHRKTLPDMIKKILTQTNIAVSQMTARLKLLPTEEESMSNIAIL